MYLNWEQSYVIFFNNILMPTLGIINIYIDDDYLLNSLICSIELSYAIKKPTQGLSTLCGLSISGDDYSDSLAVFN